LTPSAAVRDLGINLDSGMSTISHSRKTVSTRFAVSRQLRSIRRSVSRPAVQSLVTSLVLSCLDYGNATLAGIPQNLLWRLQSVMNAAARLIYSSSKFDHITPLLRQPHWLKSTEMIDFKHPVLVLKCVHGLRLHTSPMNLVVQLILKLDSEFDRHRHLYWPFVELALRPCLIGHFR